MKKIAVSLISSICFFINQEKSSFAGDNFLEIINKETTKPNTGDTGTLIVYVLVILIASLILLAVNYKGFKRKKVERNVEIESIDDDFSDDLFDEK